MDLAPRQAGPLDLGGVALIHGVALAALLIARGTPPLTIAPAPIMAQLMQATAAPPAPPVAKLQPKPTPPLAMLTPARSQKPSVPPHQATPVPVAAPKADTRALRTTAAESPREIAAAPVAVPRPTPTPAAPLTPEPVPSPPATTVTQAARPLAPSPTPPTTTSAAATATPAPTVAPRPAAGTSGTPADNRAYFAALLQQLNRFKLYPAALRKDKIEGRVVLRFTIDAHGSVVRASVERSSGHVDLDRAAERMLTRASPLPAIPPSMGKTRLTLSVPIEYSLLTDR